MNIELKSYQVSAYHDIHMDLHAETLGRVHKRTHTQFHVNQTKG